MGILATKAGAYDHAVWASGAATALLATQGGREFRWVERQGEPSLAEARDRVASEEYARLWEAGTRLIDEPLKAQRRAVADMTTSLREVLVSPEAHADLGHRQEPSRVALPPATPLGGMGPHLPRAGGPDAWRGQVDGPGDRRTAVHQLQDGWPSRQQHPGQARGQ